MTPTEEVEHDLGEFYTKIVDRKEGKPTPERKSYLPQVEVQKLGDTERKSEERRQKPKEQDGGGTAGPPKPSIFAISPQIVSTAGNGTVLVVGANFMNGATVRIDGIICSTQFISPNQLSATTPAHAAGFVDVQVVNPTGQFSNILSGALQYANAPSFTSITPDNGTHDGGTAVTIVGTGFESGVTVAFDSTQATSIVLVDANTITCVTPAHADGIVNVTITNHPSNFTATGSYTYGGATPGVLDHFKIVVIYIDGTPQWGASGVLVGIKPGLIYRHDFGAFDASDNFLSTFNGHLNWVTSNSFGAAWQINNGSPPEGLAFTNGISHNTASGFLFQPPNPGSGNNGFQSGSITFNYNWTIDNNNLPP